MADTRIPETTAPATTSQRARKGSRKLTARQARFVDEYLIDLNATQAAIRAGYSRHTAGKIGPQLLGKTGIRTALRTRQNALQERAGVRQEQVIVELAAIAFADLGDYIESDESGERLRPLSELTRAQRRAVADARQFKNGFRLRLHSKLQALDMLARHLGLYRTG